MVHVRVPAATTHPGEVVVPVVPDGIGSFTTMPAGTSVGPLFVTVIV